MEKSNRFQVTLFTDLHHGDAEHLDFNCKRALSKLEGILNDTGESAFYISLGDLVDFLHEDSTDLYEEAVEFLAARGVPPLPGGTHEGRAVYHVLGNHETAFIDKRRLGGYVPHVEGVGSVYSFRRGSVLFLVLDGNFDRETGKDSCHVMRSSTTFTFPPSEIRWAKEEVGRNLCGIKSIVWLCHVAYKDLDEASREEMVRAIASFGLPLCIFEGHTHTERFTTAQVDGWEIPIYTLAPVTFDFTVPKEARAESLFYYTATFEGGRLLSVQKRGGVKYRAE